VVSEGVGAGGRNEPSLVCLCNKRKMKKKKKKKTEPETGNSGYYI
jgi:hypothetical protein